MARRPPWEDEGLAPRFRELSKKVYPDKVEGARLICAAMTGDERRMAKMRLETALVERYGNSSEKFGVKFGLWPSWAGADFKCKDGGVEMDY